MVKGSSGEARFLLASTLAVLGRGFLLDQQRSNFKKILAPESEIKMGTYVMSSSEVKTSGAGKTLKSLLTLRGNSIRERAIKK